MKFTGSTLLSIAMLATSAFSSPVDSEKRQSKLPQSYDYDDTAKQLSYSTSVWTHLTNQGHKLKDGTESYTGVNGEVVIANPIQDQLQDLRIYSTKKGDRGAFNIYCGSTLMGSGNEYSAGGETDSTLVAEVKGYFCTSSYLVMKNDRGAKYMALDEVEFIRYYAN